MAGTIYMFAGMAPMRHPLDPKKSNKALGFPTMITGLCQFYRVPVTPSKVIRPPITRAFIKKYCTPRQAQGEEPQQQVADAPPPPQQSTSASLQSVEHYLRHVVCQQAANHQGQVWLHEYFYQYTLSQQGQGSTPFICPTSEQFGAAIAWPGDWPDA